MRLVSYFAGALALTTLACGPERPPTERLSRADAPIVGGSEDDGHHYAIGVGDDFNGPWCSATLISPQTVMTAAHCALGITRVYFGKTLTSSAPADMEVIHPLYNEDGNTPDIALVRLAAPVSMQAAPLLRKTLGNTPEFIGPDWTWVGFGVDNPDFQSGFGIRRVTTIPLAGVGPQNDPVPISEYYVSYLVDSSSPCFGDSGGPAFHVSAGVEHAAAVASWVGDDFCSTFGAHTRADQTMITSWLQGVLDSFEPNGPCKNDGTCNEMCNTDEIGDPDCHESHCAADGICALACVAPLDPDCANIAIDHCGSDGVCDPSCPLPDPDCEIPSTSSLTSTTTATVGPVTVGSMVGTTVASTTSGAGGATGTAGAGGDSPAKFDRENLLYGRGCASVAAPPAQGHLFALGLGLGLFGLRRRRGACQGGRS